MSTRLILLAVALLVFGSAGAPAGMDPVKQLRDEMNTARKTLSLHFEQINDRSGLAATLEERIDSDTAGLERSEKPPWISDADFLQYNRLLADLDASLVAQLATGAYHSLSAVRGPDDILYKSPVDGMMQPMGVYVPPSYDPQKATPLVIFLHGRTVSENDIIANPWVRAAADSTGSIVVAPYARGDTQYVDPASAEIYAALDEAKNAFHTDPRRVYLAGHSMGGYGVFVVGPKHPENWAAIMAVSGGITTATPEDVRTLNSVLNVLQRTPFYLVVGAQDPIVEAGFMRKVETFLRGSGFETHYYEEPGGLHSIGTIGNSFERAWRDMLAHRSERARLGPGILAPATAPPRT